LNNIHRCNQIMETHKRYIDYVITVISTSSFYVSKTSVSPDVDLITTDATSSLPSSLSRPLPLSAPHHHIGMQLMPLPCLRHDTRSRISSGSMWVVHTRFGRGGGGLGGGVHRDLASTRLVLVAQFGSGLMRRFGDATADGIRG
jgi:hypothetical protein